MSIDLQFHGEVAEIVLDRAAKRNALDEPMLTGLLQATDTVRERSDIRVLVLRSSSSAFCAGADIRDWTAPGAERATHLALLGHRVFRAIAELPQPSIAALNGPVMGGGLELALACDLRITTLDARLAFPEARLGNLPSWGGLPRLVDLLGPSRARYMLMTGRQVSGRQALDWGLCVDGAEDDSDLRAVTGELAEQVLECDPTALALVKSLVPAATTNPGLEAALAVYTGLLPASSERKRAFLQRR